MESERIVQNKFKKWTRCCAFSRNCEKAKVRSITKLQDEIYKVFFLEARESNEIFNSINSGRWLEVLEREDFKGFLEQQGSENFDKEHKLGFAVAALLAFTQDNFTGPDITAAQLDFKSFKNDSRWNIERIAVDGIEWNANARNIALLVVSRNFLEDLIAAFPSDLVSDTCCVAKLFVTLDSFLANQHLVPENDQSLSKVAR